MSTTSSEYKNLSSSTYWIGVKNYIRTYLHNVYAHVHSYIRTYIRTPYVSIMCALLQLLYTTYYSNPYKSTNFIKFRNVETAIQLKSAYLHDFLQKIHTYVCLVHTYVRTYQYTYICIHRYFNRNIRIYIHMYVCRHTTNAHLKRAAHQICTYICT